MEKTRRELELEKIILQNKAEAILLKSMIENSILVKNTMRDSVDGIIENSNYDEVKAYGY